MFTRDHFIWLGLCALGIALGLAVGSEITRRRKVWIIAAVGFLIGMIITVAEPDLQVLANQVPAIENNVIIWSVAVGVGVFLVIALLRIVLGIQLRWLLIGFYAVVFILAMFVSPDFLPFFWWNSKPAPFSCFLAAQYFLQLPLF